MAPLGDIAYSSPYNTTSDTYDYNTKENEHEDGTAKSRRVSGQTVISSIPPSISCDDLPHSIQRRNRPPFRSPSSVRALQLSSPEPGSSPRHFNSERKRQKWSLGAVHNMNVAEDLDTEGYDDDSHSEIPQHMMAQKRQDRYRHLQNQSQRHVSDATTDTMQQPPLVLLHITVLPSTVRYSKTALGSVAPAYVLNNMRLLEEKLNDIVFSRGILVSHPCEEYDLMEERLLEALELVAPRISPCGHFLGNDSDSFLNDSKLDAAFPSEALEESTDPQQAICNYAHADSHDDRSSSQTSNADRCDTCDEPLRTPFRGAGHGMKRWEISFYAANGLMRAGAWAAAWQEMERVDVEISPWIPDDVKRALEVTTREEEEQLAKLKHIQDLRTAELQQDLREATQRAHQLEEDMILLRDDMERMRRATASPSSHAQSLQISQHEASDVPAPLTEGQKQELPKVPSAHHPNDIPIGRLLMRYLWLLAQDKGSIIAAVVAVMITLLGVLIAPKLMAKELGPLATIDTSLASVATRVITSMSSLATVPTSSAYHVTMGNGSVETAAPAHRP